MQLRKFCSNIDSFKKAFQQHELHCIIPGNDMHWHELFLLCKRWFGCIECTWISWDQNQCSPLGSYSLLQLQLLGIALHTLCTCLHFAKSDNVLCNNSLHPAAELLTALQCDHKSCIALRRAAARHLSSTGTWNDTFHLLVPPL